MAMAGGIGAGISAIGDILGGISAMQRSKAAAKTLKRIGHEATRERLLEGQRLLGAQRVAFAKGGVDPGTGSALDVQAETAGIEMLAARRIQSAYDREAAAIKLAGQAALLSGLSLGGGKAAEGAIRYLGQSTGSGTLGPTTRFSMGSPPKGVGFGLRP
ncbi:MAG: hypothetical protein ACREMG_00025 [Gemmatimonadales bacterium]